MQCIVWFDVSLGKQHAGTCKVRPCNEGRLLLVQACSVAGLARQVPRQHFHIHILVLGSPAWLSRMAVSRTIFRKML